MIKKILIIALIAILLGAGIYFLFFNHAPAASTSSNSYQSPIGTPSSNSQTTAKYGSLNLTPSTPTTDSSPTSTANIANPIA